MSDDRPQLVDGRTVRLTCGCQLMREPDVRFPKQRWFCHGAWRTAPRGARVGADAVDQRVSRA